MYAVQQIIQIDIKRKSVKQKLLLENIYELFSFCERLDWIQVTGSESNRIYFCNRPFMLE